MNGSEIYNEILQNTHNLKGTWEVTAENYLKVDGMTNGSIVLFDQTVGALGDFVLEWTAEQKGGSYIHSNLCPSLRYTPEDAGIEGGGDNYAMLVYLCNYGGNPGTFNLRTEGGIKSEINTSGVSLNIDTVYTFKFERLNGVYKLYQDGVLINTATDITKRKLYLGWYLWYGGSNADYQTNFILREYSITKINTYHYLDTIGLTTLWSKIKSLFATKTELSNGLNSKANDSEVVHKSGDETIAGSKIFSQTRNKFWKAIDLYHNEDYKLNTNPPVKTYQYVFFTSKSGWHSGFLENQVGTDGSSFCNLLARNTNDKNASVQLAIDSNNIKTLNPVSNNDIKLGTSSKKWSEVWANTFNGINPGALSLPSNNAVNILSALQSGGYIAPSNGYVRAIKNVQTECSSTFGIRNETTGIEDRRITERVFVLGVIVPVQAGEKVIISDDWNSVSNATITYSASFYPCKGNV